MPEDVIEDMAYLKAEFDEMKNDFLLKLNSQEDSIAKLRAKTEVMSMQLKCYSRLSKRFKLLAQKWREQRAQVDILVRIMSGKFSCQTCKCGRTINQVIVQDEAMRSQYFDNDARASGNNIKEDPRTAGENSIDEKTITEQQGEKFTYSKEQRNRAQQTTPKFYRDDPVNCLDENGRWRFKTSEKDKRAWKQIASNKKATILSELVMLPQELSGATIWCILCGVEKKADIDDFYVSISAPPFIKENMRIKFPIEFSLQVEMKLLNGSYFVTDKHKFKLLEPDELAHLGNFFIPLTNCDRKHLPELVFKFSK